MSIEAVAWAYTIDATPTERNVAFVLALYADSNGECWPGLETIAEIANMDRRSVIRSINGLEGRKLVERIERGHKGQSTKYLLKGVTFCSKSDTFGSKGDNSFTRILLLLNKEEVVLGCEKLHPIDQKLHPINDKGERNDTQPIGEFAEWIDAFVEMSAIPISHIHPQKAADAIQKMVDAGATIDDMRTAYQELGDGYTILGPWSMLNPTISAMSKRRRNGKSKQAKEEYFSEIH